MRMEFIIGFGILCNIVNYKMYAILIPLFFVQHLAPAQPELG